MRFVTLAAFALTLIVRPGLAQGSEYIEVMAQADLDYGMVTRASGEIFVGRSYPYIGKFKIRARVALPPGSFPEVDLTFAPPSGLDGPGDTIPYVMEASTNSEEDNPTGSTSISGLVARITLEDFEGTENGLPVYSAYAYVFGTINVGSASTGDYGAPLVLDAELVSSRPPACAADAWSRRTRYYAGDVVTHDGAAWEANRFTIGNEPGLAHDWDDPDDRPGGGEGQAGGGRPWDLITLCE